MFAIVCAIFLALLSGFGASSEETVNDPTKFYCVCKDKEQFTEASSDNAASVAALAGELNNGHDLTLNIFDLSYHIEFISAKIALEWSKQSKTNVCFVTYSKAKDKKKTFVQKIVKSSTHFSDGQKMISADGVEKVAKTISDLIIEVRKQCKTKATACIKNLKQVTIVGFGMGVHVASRASQHLRKDAPGENIQKFIAFDPLRISKKDNDNISYKEDADYVQVVHTPDHIGTKFTESGHANIQLKYISESKKLIDLTSNPAHRHKFAFTLNSVIAMKKWLGMAATDGFGGFEQVSLPMRKPKPNQCVIGVYSDKVPEAHDFSANINENQMKILAVHLGLNYEK